MAGKHQKMYFSFFKIALFVFAIIVGFLLDDTLLCVLDFKLCATLWAETSSVTGLDKLGSAVHTSGFTAFEPVSEMLVCISERPFHLGSGERAKLPTQFH